MDHWGIFIDSSYHCYLYRFIWIIWRVDCRVVNFTLRNFPTDCNLKTVLLKVLMASSKSKIKGGIGSWKKIHLLVPLRSGRAFRKIPIDWTNCDLSFKSTTLQIHSLSVCFSVSMSVSLSVCLYVSRLSFCLSVCPSVRLSVCPSICLSVCLWRDNSWTPFSFLKKLCRQ